ncbi:protein yebF 1, partial [Yersinia pestis PY-89]
MYRLFF